MTTPAQSATDGKHSSPHLEAGAVIDGYKLIERLGKGGFGEVWKAHAADGILVALKFIPIDEKAGTLEKRSLDLIKNTRHANLVALFRAWKRDRYLVFAMELGDRTLLARLEEAQQQGHVGIPRDELLEYMRDAARGIDFLNQQKVQHRDIKPHNLLLFGGSVKVADFGLAKLMEHTVNDHSGAVTPAYAAPEFLKNLTSPCSDQYSLAVTYCQLRGGRLPFGGNPAQMVTGHLMLPPDLKMLPAGEQVAVARALAKEPAERWTTCRALVDALAGATVVAPQHGLPGSPPNLNSSDTLKASDSSAHTVPAWPYAANAKRWLLHPSMIAAVVLFTIIVLFGIRQVPWVEPALAKAPFDAAQARKSQQKWAAYLGMNVEESIDLGGGAKMVFVLIPPGAFMMGSAAAELKAEVEKRAYSDEVPQHEVTITQPFYLGKYEVSQSEYVRLMRKSNPSYFSVTGGGKAKITEDTGQYPVERVTVAEAEEFCALLKDKLGAKWARARLPSEAMWEYACRAGTQTCWHVSDVLDARDANFKDTNLLRTRAVGGGTANAFGLYDMHGNVHEWCSDWKGKYDDPQQSDPEGPQSGSGQVMRGGGWNDSAKDCRSAYRSSLDASVRHDGVGFRVALVPSGR